MFNFVCDNNISLPTIFISFPPTLLSSQKYFNLFSIPKYSLLFISEIPPKIQFRVM